MADTQIVSNENATETTENPSAGGEWMLTAMAAFGGMVFLGIGVVTMSVFPVGGIIESALGAVTLFGVVAASARHGR